MGITTRIFKKVANAGSAVANSRFGQAVADKANAANNKLTQAAEKVLTSPSKIIKYDEDGMPKGLNGLGYSVIGLSTAASVVTSAYNENERKHIGTRRKGKRRLPGRTGTGTLPRGVQPGEDRM